ncbi:MAG: carboxypeptidase-like regulatory domain-containing protein [Pirellula sp.]|jgi:hypothetical protein|nr:carboxypeptidase-like regulatory domain-containing protein [Pirellula sp.]
MSSKTIKRLGFLFALTSGLLSTPAISLAAERDVASVNASPEGMVNGLFAQQWVTPDASGDVSGSVVGLSVGDKTPVNGLPVFLVKDGQIEVKTKTNAEGNFTLPAVKPGSYSLVVRDANTIGAFSLQVVSSDHGRSLGSVVEVRVVKPAAKVNAILEEQTLPTYAMRTAGVSVITSSDPLGQSRTFAKSQAVKMDEFGKLTGRIGTADSDKDMSDMNVFVMKDGVQVAKATVAKDGSYVVDGLKPGVYGFIAVGESGFAAMSFELVKDSGETLNSKGEKLIGLFKHACSHMNVECVPCPAVTVCEVAPVVTTEIMTTEVASCGEVVVDSPVAAAPGCGCGWGGAGMGGGFGGGGGGGIGGGGSGWVGLAGIAGLATVAGIVAADNGDEAPIASPN